MAESDPEPEPEAEEEAVVFAFGQGWTGPALEEALTPVTRQYWNDVIQPLLDRHRDEVEALQAEVIERARNRV